MKHQTFLFCFIYLFIYLFFAVKGAIYYGAIATVIFLHVKK